MKKYYKIKIPTSYKCHNAPNQDKCRSFFSWEREEALFLIFNQNEIEMVMLNPARIHPNSARSSIITFIGAVVVNYRERLENQSPHCRYRNF